MAEMDLAEIDLAEIDLAEMVMAEVDMAGIDMAGIGMAEIDMADADMPDTDMADPKPSTPQRGGTTGENGSTNVVRLSPIPQPSKQKDAGSVLTKDAYEEVRKYKIRVDMGAAIGPSRNVAMEDGAERCTMGTFGCYVQVKTVEDPEGSKWALTNYHVIRGCLDSLHAKTVTDEDGEESVQDLEPQVGTILAGADRHGFPSNLWSAEMNVPVTSPPLQAHTYITSKLTETITLINEQGTPDKPHMLANTIPRLENEIAWRQAFFDMSKPLFGFPFIGSGMGRRTKENAFLDWALICGIQTERVGSNRIPDFSAWAEKYDLGFRPNPWECGMPLEHPSYRRLADMYDGEPVFKVGAATGPTAGVYRKPKLQCDLASAFNVYSDDPTLEHVVVSCPPSDAYPNPPFANEGDSGAVVFNRLGEAVGLYWGIVDNDNGKVNYFVTPIEAVFEDVKALADGYITDIQVVPMW